MIGASKKVEAEILDEHEVFVGKDENLHVRCCLRSI